MLRQAFRCLSYKLPGDLTVVGAGEVVPKGFVKPHNLYKPLQQVEYDLKGQTLLYSAPTFAGFSPFFSPWTITKWSIPLQGLAWYLGYFGAFGFLAPVTILLSISPHLYYLERLRTSVHKVWLVRGSNWLLETSGEHLVTKYTVTKQENVAVLNSSGVEERFAGVYSDYLNDKGQLKTDLYLQLHCWMDFQEAKYDQNLKLSKKGTVHNPELLFALLRGYKIDDSGFRVNEDPENSLVSNVCIGGKLSPEK